MNFVLDVLICIFMHLEYGILILVVLLDGENHTVSNQVSKMFSAYEFFFIFIFIFYLCVCVRKHLHVFPPYSYSC